MHLATLGIGATIVNGCVQLPDGLLAVPIHGLPKIRYWTAWRPQRQALVQDLLDQIRQQP